MAELQGLLSLLSLLAAALLVPSSSSAINRCPAAALAGFEAELSVACRQLRGVVRVLDACSFSVSGFDMASPAPGSRVRWWGAAGVGPGDLLAGFPVSDFALDRTFRNDTLVVPLVNATWDHIAVLAVWDEAAATNFGHVVLRPNPTRPTSIDEKIRKKKRRRDHSSHGKNSFVVTSGPDSRHPNPPNPSREEEEAQSVPASPREFIWSPDRDTPDQLYYHSFHGRKMGGKVQVVDGDLSDMYNNSVPLDDKKVTFFWTLSHESISIAARCEKECGYLAIGFGDGMVNSYVYVGWTDNSGKARVTTYWIDGRSASSVHPTSENLTQAQCKSENGIITLEFTRALSPSCSGKIECKNVVDPSTPLKVIWAMGAQWSGDHLSERNKHSRRSDKPVRVLLTQGLAEQAPGLHPVLAVHGFMMFVAWVVLLPGGILAARYLKHVKGDGWLPVHVYMQYSGLAIILFALLLVAAELRGFSISSIHAKFGVAAITLASAQPINAYWRPRKLTNGEIASSKRIVWEYIHVITGRGAIIVGVVALFSGMKHVVDVYDIERTMNRLTWALMLWIMVGVLVVLYLEYLEVKRIRKERNSFRDNRILGDDDEDDSVDLLHLNGTVTETFSPPSEVQLEPLSR